jgi:hypothetical protein
MHPKTTIMKKLLFCITTALAFCCTVKAQETENTRIYEVISNIPVVACDVVGNKLSSTEHFIVPPYRSRFALVRLKGDSVVVRFLVWEKNEFLKRTFNLDSVHVKSLHGDDSIAHIHKYFLITRTDLDSNCIKVYNRGIKNSVFTLGLVTMPMKLRLGKNFDFQGNLSLGTTAGTKFRVSKYNPNFLNLLLGLSISTITLDSFSTGGRVSGQPINNMAVFSPSLGMVFEFGKAQAGIFYGWDFLNKSNQLQYQWIHNKRPWISIGFGFSIFSVNSNSSNNQTSTQNSAAP